MAGISFLVAGALIAGNAGVPSLIKGDPVPSNYLPEVRYISNSRGEQCSATIVGPQVVLTAAHCLDDNKYIFTVNRDKGPKFYAKCDVPSNWDGEDGLDMALCKNVAGPIHGDYEPATISLEPVWMHQKVLLVGFGCTKIGGEGGNDRRLRIGISTVSGLPYGRNYWFRTTGDAAVCFGDSGGPAMLIADSSSADDEHLVTGVNSRGNIEDISLITATYLPESVRFMRTFAERYGVGICGVNMDCINEVPDRAQTPHPGKKRVHFRDE